MRAILFVLILIVLAIIAALVTGLIDIDQTRPAVVPDIDTSSNGVSAEGGQAPAFDVETGSISVGAREQNVTVPMPTVAIDPADEASANQQAPAATQQPPASNAQ